MYRVGVVGGDGGVAAHCMKIVRQISDASMCVRGRVQQTANVCVCEDVYVCDGVYVCGSGSVRVCGWVVEWMPQVNRSE